jgi:hypothetical protein
MKALCQEREKILKVYFFCRPIWYCRERFRKRINPLLKDQKIRA